MTKGPHVLRILKRIRVRSGLFLSYDYQKINLAKSFISDTTYVATV